MQSLEFLRTQQWGLGLDFKSSGQNPIFHDFSCGPYLQLRIEVVMSAIRWWYVLLTWSITGVACRACHSSGTFCHCDARAKNTCPVLVATRLGGSQELETRGYILAEPNWTFWWLCDLHVSIVVLAVGLALSLYCDKLASDLIISLSWPHGSWIFFLAKPCRTWGDLHLVRSVIWRSCAWKYRLSCFKCHFIFTVLHMQHAHTSLFKKFAIALPIGFSSESLLKYERLRQKKNLSECLVVFF